MYAHPPSQGGGIGGHVRRNLPQGPAEGADCGTQVAAQPGLQIAPAVDDVNNIAQGGWNWGS